MANSRFPEKGAEMPESDRRKFAIKAVRDILKDV